MASTCHWGSVYRNTNLLQIHFPKVKPPHIATPKFLLLFIYPPIPDWKRFSKFSLISLVGGNHVSHYEHVSLIQVPIMIIPLDKNLYRTYHSSARLKHRCSRHHHRTTNSPQYRTYFPYTSSVQARITGTKNYNTEETKKTKKRNLLSWLLNVFVPRKVLCSYANISLGVCILP